MPKHSKPQDCEQFLQTENSLTPDSEKIVETYLRVSVNGLDEFLVLIQNKIRNNDHLHYILSYMRAHGQFDRRDHERIINDALLPAMDRKVDELLAVVEQKERHAFWYLVHSFESKQEPLYRYLHGPIHCCVCKEIRHKEMEEELDSPDLEGDVTVLSFIKKAFEEKCSTAKAAVKKVKDRRNERKNAAISNTVATTEETEDVTSYPVDEEKETGDEEYTDAEDLESDVTLLSFIKRALKEAIEEKCSTAKAAVKRVKDRRNARKNATRSRKISSTGEASHVIYTLDEDLESDDEDYIDAEGLPLRDFFDEIDEPKRAKDDVNAMKDWTTVTSEQQLSALTRRKRAYKAAFTSLSAVSMFTFYCDPLPAFDFLFLFIYCNLLILLITF